MGRESKILDEQTLIEGIRSGDREVYEWMYRKYFNMIYLMVQKNSGDLEDAKDLFQDTLIELVKNMRQLDFTLTSKISTYLYAIARNIWFSRLRSDKKAPVISTDKMNTNLPESPDEIELKEEEEKKLEVSTQMLSKLNKDCQELLRMFYFYKRSLTEIAEKLGLTYGFAKLKRKRCMDYWINEVRKTKW